MLMTTEMLTRQGLECNSIRRLIDCGDLVRVRRGVYADKPLPDDRVAAHLMRARAQALTLAEDKVFSHQTAGAIHGLPVWRPMLTRIAVTRPGRSGGQLRPELAIRVAPLAEDEIVLADEWKVTSIPRTAADLGRMLPLEWGLPVLDAALRAGVTREDLAEQVARARRRPGVRTLAAGLNFADGLSESPGESIARLVFMRLGIPAPVLQRDIVHSVSGLFLGRPDFSWPDLGIFAEFDGSMKYTRGVEEGDLADVVMREKRRELAICADDWSCFRMTWAELFDPQLILALWQVALNERGGRGR
ncbi:type IV toxin-antitoxin system AbiEi family antitoxin domain-containing protein [Ammonicoccus fulvus]|uniref:Type IV toxin-antitoxin system AbiEi family antitoxin domain-containing protein n=1 Tax=Ammonicoccus fulvus TaxID=3138240 RepID=A0ABZ3FM54_9ACTN